MKRFCVGFGLLVSLSGIIFLDRVRLVNMSSTVDGQIFVPDTKVPPKITQGAGTR
ncbi:hypothetical protein IQ266_05790 [filamentous cyanobacterium LEGE 11480]|uniref:Uncharacterized protein n=1 Tax=Romeriopsis navalis LEGE 11480 TaxID=2777977 RepID=A0A928VMS6_9CYAN|nr:hypothetical protein [Romeriopsis navalis]MBE9029272.1 hypothetical protein [Romeriopsis navalis LEGE 11480]